MEKKIRALPDKKNKYSNSRVVRKIISERKINPIVFFRKPWGCRPDQPVNFLFNRSDISQPTSGQFCVLLYKLTSPADHTLLPFFYYILKL